LHHAPRAARDNAQADAGALYPALPRIREVSTHIAAAVAQVAYRRGLAATKAPADPLVHVRAQMYDPRY
jgi:malate dehydrogenase (oxaloacetate-decarboxylating)(NADP+)